MQNELTRQVKRKVLVLREADCVWADEAKAQVLETVEAIHQGLRQAGHQVIPIPLPSPNALLSVLQPYKPGQYLIFNAYEGIESGAEDGAQATALLEQLGYLFTGADALAFRKAQDKLRTKRVLLAHDIPTPQYHALSKDGANGWNIYPAIVKVANEHGSECLTEECVVNDAVDLADCAARLHAAGYKSLMVSEFIAGREFTVALWGNDSPECLPIMEVDYSACPASMLHLKTCSAKWDVSSAAYQNIKLVPPQDLSSALVSRIEEVAKTTYRAFGLRDYGRIDIRMRDEIPYVIDVNCNPALSVDSSFVAAAAQGGYDYPAMLDRILQFAIHRAGTS